jgi:CotH kinase protein/Lamin Tail Domain/GEVED domain/Chitobiase/beta-hexosaminidase C-terminal domain/Secretion system C-terminal sorting domain/Divergent InlB B-repeat domain
MNFFLIAPFYLSKKPTTLPLKIALLSQKQTLYWMNASLMRICAIVLAICYMANYSAAQTTVTSPIPSLKGGFYRNAVFVTLFTSTPNSKIYYTTDGSEPTAQSLLYSAGLTFPENTPLRARAFATGLTPSAITTNTYFINIKHTFPIVALTFKNGDFFDPATGIYTNFEKPLTAPVNVEFFETDGTLKFAQSADAAIQGTTSSLNAQKSLEIKAKKGERFLYKIFPESPFEDYNVFVLRNAGQDWNITMFRDAFVSSLIRDIADIKGNVAPPLQYTQAYRPSIVYLNGKYWGIHNIRERMNKQYITQHFNLKDTEYDLVENWSEAKVGDTKEWENFYSLFSFMNFDGDANYEIMKQKIDMPAFIDYHVFNVIIDNFDWPSNNNRRFRLRNPNGKWRWLTFDLDFTFGLYNPLAWNTGDPTQNSMVRLMDGNAKAWPNADYSTLVFRKLMDNPNFRQDFFNRMSDYLNVYFNPARVNARISQFETLYAPEIEQHDARWALNTSPFSENVQKLRKFANERVPLVKKHIVEYFGDVLATSTITTATFPQNTGDILVNTTHISKATPMVTGSYFTGINLPLTAIPTAGYEFAGWSDPALGNSPNIVFRNIGDKGITANFRAAAAQPAVVINELYYDAATTGNDWIELYNPSTQNVNLSGWVLTTNSGANITIPTGTVLKSDDYLVVTENILRFELLYPTIKKVISADFSRSVDIKFNTSGGIIQLKNNSDVVVDEAKFIGTAASSTDKNVTFQLGIPQADNLQLSNWTPQQSTPAAKNINGILAIAAATATNNTTTPLGYCNVQTTTPWDEWIGGVKFGGINNLTSKTQYFRYNNLRPEVMAGTSNEIRLTTSFSTLPYPETWRVWIDYNRNGIFEADEKAWEASVAAPPRGYTISSVSSNINIPANAQPGLTVMRVSMKRNNFAEPCESFQYGEIEDYTVLIKPNTTNVANPTTPPITTPTTTAPPVATPAAPTPIPVAATQSTYCAASSNYPWEEWINRVSVANLDKASSKAVTNDFTTTSTATLEKNKDYPMTLSVGFSYITFAEYWRVWIDYNRDGDFEDAGENILSFTSTKPANGTPQQATTVTLRIPSEVQAGNTRMRISMTHAGYPNPCGALAMGETEDYMLNIVNTQSSTIARANQTTDVQFDTHTGDKSVELFWNVASFRGVRKVEVERMDELGREFLPIFTQNFVSSILDAGFYRTNDEAPAEGVNYYRLHVVFADGSSLFSSVRQSVFAKKGNFTIYPNPATTVVNLQLQPWLGLDVTAKIYNTMGKLLVEHHLGILEKASTEIDISNINEGIYVIYLTTGSRTPISRLLSVTE